MLQYNDMLDEINNINLIDSYYITPNGYLYSSGEYGHKKCDLNYTLIDIQNNIKNGKSLKDIFNNENLFNDIIKESKFIEKNGYNFDIDLEKLLDILKRNNNISNKTYSTKTIPGLIMAHSYFYKFFEDLIKYCDNPDEEFNKLMNFTNSYIIDILVRCCGFHKIESKNKTIITSCVNYEIELMEYIEKGWTIEFISPYIIDKENGVIKEYTKDFITIKKVLKYIY